MTFVSYAQNFEDVILWRVLHDVEGGRYIDIGAHDPLVDSVSMAFYEAGWRGIHVEPTPTYAAKLREARPDEIVIEAAVTDVPGPIQFHEFPETGLSTGRSDIAKHHSKGGFGNRQIVVPCIRLDQLFEMIGQPVHWLKIDVEGMESNVLRSWGENSARPWMVVVEATFPGTQKSTKEDWIEEIVGRGYREIYFDGLSSYFLHEGHADLATRLKAPPNVFDGFQLASTHFSAGMLMQISSDELDRAHTEAAQREAQMERELAGVRQELAVISATMYEIQAARATTAEALAASEQKHAATIDQAWRERQAAEASLRQRWSDVENELRGQIIFAETQIRQSSAELAALRERSSQQHDRIEQLRQENQVARQRAGQLATELEGQITRAQAEIAELTSENGRSLEVAAGERDALSRQLAEKDRTIAEASDLIRKALAEPLDGWQRLGRALGLSPDDGARNILRSWDVNSPQPVVEKVDSYMSLASSEEMHNPYLRANSLFDLLSWSDVEFVRCAYVTILGRQPDKEGEIYYTDRLRRGYSKMHVLWQLRKSREGPRHDPGIAGLDRALRQAKRARIPVLGVFFRPLNAQEGGSAAARRHRELLNKAERILALQERQLIEQHGLRAWIDRLPVSAPTELRAVDEISPASDDGLLAVRTLSADARRLYDRFSSAR